MPDAADELSDNESEEARTLPLGRQPLVHICIDFRRSAQSHDQTNTAFAFYGVFCNNLKVIIQVTPGSRS